MLVLIICTLFSFAGKGQNLQLEIQGKDSLETAVIDSLGYVKIHISYNDLSKEIDSVFQRVQKMGFVDAEVFPPKKINDSLYTGLVFLGKKYRWLKVHYETLPLETRMLKNLTIKLRPNYFVVPFGNVEDVLIFLNQQIANRGQPFSYLQLEAIQKGKKDTLTAHLKSVSSKTRKIDEIIVKGYEKFPVSYLT
ncbi:MAG TPA: hypothetical protein VFM65_00090, partial [Flavobacteriaceae bacterium]|nr:hypothetical protein [Flavobacteriaceae bacterium]